MSDCFCFIVYACFHYDDEEDEADADLEDEDHEENDEDDKDEQVRIHDRTSSVRWAGALMEVRSLFGLNPAIKKTRYRRTDQRADRP